MRRREFLRSVAIVAAAIYAPGWKPPRWRGIATGGASLNGGTAVVSRDVADRYGVKLLRRIYGSRDAEILIADPAQDDAR